MRSMLCVIIAVECLVLVSVQALAGERVDPEASTSESAPPASGEAGPPDSREELQQWQLIDSPELHRPLNPRTLRDQEKLEAYTYYCVGRLLENRRDFTGALEMYQRALSHDPEAVAIYNELIPLAFRLGRNDEAMRYVLKLAELDPSDHVRLRQLASYLAQPNQGDFDRAIRLLELAVVAPNMVQESPDYVNVMNDLGRYYVLTEQNEKAAEAYQAVMEALEDPDKYRIDRASLQLLATDRNYEQIGKAFLKAGRPSDAIDAFEKAEEAATNKGRFSYNLAQVYFETGENGKALAELEKYFDRGLGARNREPLDLVKQIHKQLDQLDDLIGFLERAAEKDPQNSVLQLYLADEYRAARQFDQAEARYRAILEGSDRTEPNLGLAEVYRETGRPKELLVALSQILQSQEGGIRAIANEINAVVEKPELIDALADVARNAQDLPGGSMHVMALIAAKAERVDSAVEFFELALEQQPEKASMYMEFGRMYELNGQHEEAASVYQKAIDRGVESKPAPWSFHIALAQQLEQAGQTDEAIAAAQGALAISDNILTRYWYSWVYYDARRFEDARSEFEKLLEYTQESPLAAQNPEIVADITRTSRFILSNIHFELGDLSGAEKMLEQVLEETPDDHRANNDLGYLLADQGKDLDRAESMIRKAIEKQPDNGAYLDSMGWILYKKGSFQESIDYLEKAVEKLEEGDSVIWDHLGDAYLRTDQVEKARSAWQKAIELFHKQREPNEKKIEEIEAKLNVTVD